MTKTQDKKWTIVESSFEPIYLKRCHFSIVFVVLGVFFWDKMGFGPQKKEKTQIGSCDSW